MSELRTDFINTYKLDFNDPEWTEAWHHNRKLKRINKGITIKALGKFFLENGYKYITVEYEGAGDSGDAYHAEGFTTQEAFDKRGGDHGWDRSERVHDWGGDGETLEKGTRNQKELVEMFNTYIKLNPENGLSSGDDTLHWLLVSFIDYDWYNNEGGQGEVVWNIENETINVDGEQNYQGNYECSEKYSLNGEDPDKKYKDKGHH